MISQVTLDFYVSSWLFFIFYEKRILCDKIIASETDIFFDFDKARQFIYTIYYVYVVFWLSKPEGFNLEK